MLQHRIELQLMPRPRLMRRQRPRHRVEREVVILVRRRPIRPWDIQRQHKLAPLPGIVQKRRWLHMRCGLLCRLGCRRQADDRRPLRQSHQPLRDKYLLDRLQPRLVDGRMASPVICVFFNSRMTSR